MKTRKASLTLSPLSRPKSPIYALAQEFQRYLHFPDPAPLYATMGAVAGNMISGNPVWLMLVGPPACGKTELLNSLMGIASVHGVSTIKGPGALLSGTATKEKAKGATGGLLRQVGDRGALIFKDFTSILSLPHDPLLEILSALREIYDGKWDRVIGTEGGRVLSWTGKIAVLGGVTQAIDRHHSVIAEMGERWVFFRYPESDGWGESKSALSNSRDPQVWRKELQDIVAGFFDGLGLDWGNEDKRRELEQGEWTRLIAMATLAAKCRSVVVRHAYTREVEDVPQAESPTRLATVLGQLYLGMEQIGLDERDRWDVTGRIALDCMPQVRRKSLDVIRTNQRERGHVESTATFDEVQAGTMCSRSTVLRTLEDMQIHGVTEKVKDKGWRLTAWAEERMREGWAVLEQGEKDKEKDRGKVREIRKR